MNLDRTKLNEIKNNSKGGGFTFVHLLTLLFVVAKLTGNFNHSWWVVFSPLWGTALAIIGVAMVLIIALTIIHIFEK